MQGTNRGCSFFLLLLAHDLLLVLFLLLLHEHVYLGQTLSLEREVKKTAGEEMPELLTDMRHHTRCY